MSFSWLLSLAFVAAGTASTVSRESSNHNGFLSLPIQHVQRPRAITKRDADVQLFNISSISYLVQLSIGTPGQNIKVAVDTGSDELWVDPDCGSGDLTSYQVSECQADGLYSAKKSSTANITGTNSAIQYGQGEVSINYVIDNVALPGSSANLKNVQFGVASSSAQLNEGILGLGWGIKSNLQYPNIVDQLEAQNVTNSKAFSVALGSVNASNGGVLIFGGVDTKKFTGALVPNKILGRQGGENISRYWVQMTSVSLEADGNAKTYDGGNTPIVLDSGTSLTYLPRSIVSSMVDDFNGTADRDMDGLYQVSCAPVVQGGTINFAFGGVTIKVPVSEFILQATAKTCVLGALPVDPSTGVTALLGDTFLRSAYVVFDQTTNTISMAQYSNCGQAEQSIPATGAANLTGQCGPPVADPVKSAGRHVEYSGLGLIAALLAGVVAAFL